MERRDSTFGQKSRATRGLATGTPLRCLRRFGRDGPRGARYRRARCFACHKFPDGWHDRGLCAPYRFVIYPDRPAPIAKLLILGRTGRAGKQGIAITFLTNDDDEVMFVFSFSLLSPLRRIGTDIRFFRHGRYDLKQGDLSIERYSGRLHVLIVSRFPEISKSPVSKVPIELARHEAAQHKVSREMKRKRDADDQG